jgi:hypothetical protein
MKLCYLLALLLLFSRPAAAGPVTYLDLVTASTEQKVKLQVTAGGLGADNLQVLIVNQTQQELPVRVAPGLHFAATNAGTQDLFTYQQQLLVLGPHGRKTIRLRGFCMEQHDHGPANSTYTLRGWADRGLQPLGDSLFKYPALGENYGQLFVWAVTDQAPIDEISVAPALLRGAQNVLRYLSTITARPAGRAVASADPRPSVKTFTRNVYVDYHNPKAEVVSLKVYGPDGHERFTVLKAKPLRAGVVQYSFGLNAVLGREEEPAFTVRLLNAAGQVLQEQRVTASSPEQAATPVQQSFLFKFSLSQPLRTAYLRVRLPDGTLVEEIKQLGALPAGNHQFSWSFYHLRPASTAFVVQLETAAGQVLHQQALAAAP